MTRVDGRRSLFIGVTIVAMVLLNGCSPRGVDIPPEARDIRSCEPRSEPYRVEEIGNSDRAVCDLAGMMIVFPDGFEMAAPALGVTRGRSTWKGNDNAPAYHVFNFGAFGLVAGKLSADGERSEWWGTEEGLRRYHAVRGTDVPPMSGD